MRYSTLIEAQMGAYPNSLVLTDMELLNALYAAKPDWIPQTADDWDERVWYDNKVERRIAFIMYIELQVARAQAQWARSAFMNRAQDPAGFFYACGKREDGTYRHVGFRYGLEDSEYASSFPGLTYTPQGEEK